MKNMKKILLILFVFLLSGCSSYNMSMDINKDKSMDFSVTIMSVDDVTGNINTLKEKYEKYGYTISEYNSNNENGIRIYKHFDSIDDIANGKRADEFDLLYFYNNNYDEEIESKMFNVDSGIDTNRYAANFYVDLSNTNIDVNATTVTFSVTLPNGTFSNNANVVSEDGNSLIWNITSQGKTDIDFVFELKTYDTIYFLVAVLIAVFLVFSIISNLFAKSSVGSSTVQVRSNPNHYDADKKVENLTRNAINKSANKNQQRVQNNTQRPIPSNAPRPVQNVSKPQPVKQPEPPVMVAPGSNLVPEVNTPKAKKKVTGKLFGKKKKDKIDTNAANSNDAFSQMVNNISNSPSSNTNNDNDNINPFNGIDNPNMNDAIDTLNRYNNKVDEGNSNMDINRSVDISDSFNYEDNVNVNNNVSEDNTQINGPVINLNNKSVVVNKKDKDEE